MCFVMSRSLATHLAREFARRVGALAYPDARTLAGSLVPRTSERSIDRSVGWLVDLDQVNHPRALLQRSHNNSSYIDALISL